MSFRVDPIGFVESARNEAIDDDWDDVTSEIVVDDRYADALGGLEDFSHLEVVFVFDRVDPEAIEIGRRHPRGNPTWPSVGIFAQRAKMRPNRIGTTVCRILGIDGGRIRVVGLDAIDGTPVLDVKPYMEEFGPRGTVTQPAWSHELMEKYWEK